MDANCVISLAPADYNRYAKIIVIGDIHGCHTVLKEALGEINPDWLYIFVGDYLDRGVENREVLEFLVLNYNRENFIFLEGNHESALRSYAEDEKYNGTVFTYKTVPQISSVPKRDIRQFCRRLRQCVYFTYGDNTFLVCHGGIPTVPPAGLLTVSTSAMIEGVGSYEDYLPVAAAWHERQPENFIQIFGHRNTLKSETRLFPNVFCLEGKVELGGELRTVEISGDGIRTCEYSNKVFDPILAADVPDLIKRLRQNKYIVEKNFGCISSFNFSDKAFERGIWNEQTITARGLFIDVSNGNIVARGYRKFFNIGEREETRLETLEKTMKFPVQLYIKENGFLGMMSMYNGELFITSKSNPTSTFAGYARDLVEKCCTRLEYLKDYLAKNNVTLLFECIDIENDPHLIRYPQNRLVLLDIIDNELEFRHHSYEELKELGEKAGIEVKKDAGTIGCFSDFSNWYKSQMAESLDPGISHLEGYVIEDASGFMVKIKLPFYSKWKYMRSVAGLVYNNTPPRRTLSKHAQRFYSWLTRKVEEGLPRKSIIDLRDLYFTETGDRFDD